MKSQAFTLLEMMVAVAIMVVLGALAASAVHEAQLSGDTAHCALNLKQLAGANLLYAADHDGSYVPAQDARNLVRWHGVRQKVQMRFDPQSGPLAPYLGREGRVKLCPTLRNTLTGGSSFEDGTGGYGYNAAYIGGVPGDPFTPARIVDVLWPARTVMFTDSAFPRQNGLQEYAYAEPRHSEWPLGQFRDSLYASVHFRHSGFANVAWCDGHVTAEAPTRYDRENVYAGDAKKWHIGWFGDEQMNGPWRPY